MLPPKVHTGKRVDRIAESIAQIEGYGKAGTLAQRKNNPGNLVFIGQPGAIKDPRSRFATFKTPEDGWRALQGQIQKDAQRGHTLRSFIYKYAPPSENNSAHYAAAISHLTKIPLDGKLSQYINSPY